MLPADAAIPVDGDRDCCGPRDCETDYVNLGVEPFNQRGSSAMVSRCSVATGAAGDAPKDSAKERKRGREWRITYNPI